MNNLFNPDNKFFTFMSRVADMMILNVLCIIFCIPIVTAGASITATYYMTMKMARNEEAYIVRGFFHSFKQNLKQGIVIHLLMLLLAAVLLFDLFFSRHMEGAFYMILSYIFMAGLFVYAMLYTYIYPVLAKFYNSIKNTFKNALLMSIRHLPYTILMLLFTAAPIVIMFVIPNAFPYGLLFYLTVGFATICYIHSTFFVKIFDNYIPENAEEEEVLKEIDGSVFKNLQPVSEIPEEENTEGDTCTTE